MTAAEIHIVDNVPEPSRGPFADRHVTPTCRKCGPLTDKPVDREDARTARVRHEAAARDGVLL